MTSVAYVASVAPEAQLAFDLDGLEGAERLAPRPALSHHVQPGAARLLRKFVADGLDPNAITSAAVLVAALDEWPAEALDEEEAA